MSIGAPRPRQRRRDGGWSGRIALTLLLAIFAAGAWLFVWPPDGTPYEEGPVVVLGGGADTRLRTALELVGEPRAGRELVLSEGAYSEWEVLGRSCGEEAVRCFDPQPPNTFGEAVTFADIARERGWERATVVTSDYHLTRSRLYFHRCLDIEVAVIAADSDHSVGTRVANTLYEVLGTFAAVGNLASC